MNNVFNDIIDKYNKKHILRLCDKLIKRCSFKSCNDLELLVKLGTWMYIYKDFDNALIIFSLTDNLDFNGNWDIWNEIYSCQILKAKIYSDLNEKKTSENIKKNLNLRTTGGVLNWQSNVAKMCTPSTDGYYTQQIKNYILNNDEKTAVEYKLLNLISLLKFLEGSFFKDGTYKSKEASATALIQELQTI
ncbi:DUF6707 family protein [Clostridium beijerinckii]|uniref:DUF6707 family protein n=1 Tax=Clostridium beijerinckii TaxID=1520 RepID=UPI00156EB1D2|nr:DUF6707 family protein [Clostridium beijerinckii]NRT72107.1 hypothetical protein [Clostridium beijerinckii]